MEIFNFRPIGFLSSCYKDKFATPRQPHLVRSSRATLKVESSLSPLESLEGIEAFSHLWLIFVFHKNSNKKSLPKIHPPRLGGKSIGVFATRSPHHPNPIGLSLVRLDRREGDTLYISEVDLVEGTPILDIKPYIHEADSKTESQNGWVGSAAQDLALSVAFAEEALEQLEQLVSVDQREHFKNLIVETLSQDPRPLVYKGVSSTGNAFRETHDFRIYDLDINFKVENTKATILRIRKFEKT